MTIDETTKEIEDILNKNKLEIRYKIDFPVYRIIPPEVNLALEVLKKHNMRISMSLFDKNKK